MNITSPSAADLGSKNIFEEIFELIEQHTSKPSQSRFQLGDFYDFVNEFDLEFQRFNSDEESKNVKEYNRLLNDTIGKFVYIFKAIGLTGHVTVFYAFKRFIRFFTLALKESNKHRRFEDIEKTFYDSFPSLKFPLDLKENRAAYVIRELFELFQHSVIEIDGRKVEVNINNIEQHIYLSSVQEKFVIFVRNFPYEIGIESEASTVELYCNDFVVKTAEWEKDIVNYKIIKEEFYTIASVHIDNNEISTSKLLSPLWLITSALEQIKGVSVDLESIKTGSVHAQIQIRMKDLVAKEEVNTVLEAAREAAISELSNSPIIDSKGGETQTLIHDLEVQRLNLELAQMPSPEEAKNRRFLEDEKIRLDNERQRIENLKASIQTFQMLSELVKQGMLQPDDLRIDINGLLYFDKTDGNLNNIGPDISKLT